MRKDAKSKQKKPMQGVEILLYTSLRYISTASKTLNESKPTIKLHSVCNTKSDMKERVPYKWDDGWGKHLLERLLYLSDLHHGRLVVFVVDEIERATADVEAASRVAAHRRHLAGGKLDGARAEYSQLASARVDDLLKLKSGGLQPQLKVVYACSPCAKLIKLLSKIKSAWITFRCN